MALTVVLGDIPIEIIDRIHEQHEVVTLLPAEVAEPTGRQVLAHADGVLVTGQVPIDAAFLDAAPRLRVAALRAVGYDRVDLEECARRGVTVCNTPGVLDGAVADMTILLMLGLARRIEANLAYGRGYWHEQGERPPFGTDVRGAVLGILGMGRIGSIVARTGKHGFGMTVRYHNRQPSAEAGEVAELVSLDELFRSSDFVSIHTPLTPQTFGMIGERELSLMPPHAFLINTSRGAVVDEAALIAALQENRIAGAGLDVTVTAPLPRDHPLCALPNVLLTPHIGSATSQTRFAMADLAARNMLAVLDGKEPDNRVV